MSRRSRKAPTASSSKSAPSPRVPVAPDASGAVPVMLNSSGLSFFGGNGYQGADWSSKRGYVYFPQLDTRREIDSYSRTELLRRARFALYEAHQIRNTREIDQSRWLDGVYTDRYNRAVQYRIVGDEEQFTDVLVDDAIYWGDYERNGQNRCNTVLYHAINNLIDTTEILSFLKHGVKISNQMGFYIAAKDPNIPRGVQNVLGPQNTRTETNSDGTKTTVEDVYNSGRIPDIGFRELKTLLDERPHPNTMGLLDYLARDISWGAGLSADILWNIAALGGANSRFILADAQGFIDEKQDLFARRVVKREWNYTIAKEIKTGNLREPRINGRPAPGAWLDEVTFIPPKRITVDFGRDGKLMLDQLARGALTHERWFAMNNQDARAETKRELEFRAWRRDEAKKLGFESDPLDQVVAGGNATEPADAATASGE